MGSARADKSPYPIWTGITVSNGNPTPETIHTSNTHTTDHPVPSGAMVVASSPVNAKPLIVRYPAGIAADPNNLAGERLIFNMRAPGDDSPNLTTFGEQVFLNAVASLTGGFAPDGPFQVTITRNPDTPGSFDFEWASQPDKLYDLLSSTDLANPTHTGCRRGYRSECRHRASGSETRIPGFNR